jgi:uncharacterized protein DUF3307
MLFRTFFAICLAHLLTDFVFQTRRLMEQKRGRQARAYLLHGLTHYLSAVVIIGFFIPGSIVSLKTHVVIAGLTLVHLLMDLVKLLLIGSHRIADGSRAFAVDQLLHLLTVAVAAWLLSPSASFRELTSLLHGVRIMPNKFLAVPVVYVAVIFGGGYLIRFLTGSMAEDMKTHSPDRAGEQLQNAGLYIGWLERFLVLTALLLQSPATVGLILTAKSIARYPEFKSERFAEYFLIGTLLSISIAFVGGAFLAKLLLGQVRFSG